MSIMGTKRIPFDLTTWFANKSQKVVNSEGKEVRIICWDRKGKFPVIGLIENLTIQQYNEKGEIIYYGDMHCGPDLFLVTEDELTEFEEELKEAYYWAKGVSVDDFVEEFSPKLLSIARKQIEKEIYGSIQAEKESNIEICPHSIKSKSYSQRNKQLCIYNDGSFCKKGLPGTQCEVVGCVAYKEK